MGLYIRVTHVEEQSRSTYIKCPQPPARNISLRLCSAVLKASWGGPSWIRLKTIVQTWAIPSWRPWLIQISKQQQSISRHHWAGCSPAQPKTLTQNLGSPTVSGGWQLQTRGAGQQILSPSLCPSTALHFSSPWAMASGSHWCSLRLHSTWGPSKDKVSQEVFFLCSQSQGFQQRTLQEKHRWLSGSIQLLARER